MDTIIIKAVNDNGLLALKSYCSKFSSKKPSLLAKIVKRSVPYSEDVDDIVNPSFIKVTLGKSLLSQSFIVLPKIDKTILNILEKHGGLKDDFEVTYQ